MGFVGHWLGRQFNKVPVFDDLVITLPHSSHSSEENKAVATALPQLTGFLSAEMNEKSKPLSAATHVD